MNETQQQYVQQSLAHWQVEHDAQGILWLSCDREGESSNSLSEAVIYELGSILDQAEKLPLAGLVVQSAKEASFIVGADIREFDGFEAANEVSDKIRQGHEVFARLENLSCPTVAAIHGFALGGGLELALSCDYICALNVDATRLGFPEVKLGIFPGLGGTTRLSEKVGGMAGMQLMLTGKMLRAPAARSMGIIDELVDEFASLRWAARRAVLKKRKSRKLSMAAAMSNRQPARMALAKVLHKKTAEKANPKHYPAPFAMIDLWAEHRDNRRRMFEGEATKVGELMVGDTARNLRRIFFLTERMKGFGKAADFTVRRVHVVGAGVMGGDIAAWCVLQGFEVTLQDRALEHIEPALKRAKSLFKKRLRKKPAVMAAVARLIADVEGQGVARADVVIEAIYEDAEAKRALYASLELQINRFPLPTKSAPGFLVNRVLAPYLMEAFTLLLEGIEKETIDASAIHFGMPMGPIELADVVGLDVCMKVAETLAKGDVESQRALLQNKLDEGALGKKSGKGFYQWTKGRSDRRRIDVDSPYGDQLAQRLIKPFLEECKLASSEGIVADDDLLDAGIIFGTGFAPFRGGPMQYLKQMHASEETS